MNSNQITEAQGDLNFIISKYILDQTKFSKNDSDTIKNLVKNKILIIKSLKKI